MLRLLNFSQPLEKSIVIGNSFLDKTNNSFFVDEKGYPSAAIELFDLS